jgi:hypothetical protein
MLDKELEKIIEDFYKKCMKAEIKRQKKALEGVKK